MEIDDKTRIDFLENGGGKDMDVFIDRDKEYFAIRFWPRYGPGPEYTGRTLREAIDNAIFSEVEGLK